jgi:transcription elongation GreA/GreB family factor
MRSSSELPETSIPATIRRRLEGRLEQLNARLPRLEARAASSDDFEAEGLLFAARRELTDLEQALRRGSEKQGAWDPRRIEVNDSVRLEDVQSGARERYTIVPAPLLCRADETWISDRSPLGSSLIGSSPGEEVEVRAPGGLLLYRVIGFSRAS